MEDNWLSQITAEHETRGSKMVISGSEGVGKTSTIANMHDPLFMVTKGEQSLGALQRSGQIPETPSFGSFQDWVDVKSALRELLGAEKKPNIPAIDAADGFEHLVWDFVVKTKFGGNLSKANDYGQGWKHVQHEWREFLDLLDQLTRKGIHVVLIAHLEVKRFIDAENVDYDRWQPALNKSVWALTGRWADHVLQLSYFTHVVDGERGSRAKARGTSERVVYCTPSPTRVTKNRLGLNESYSLGMSPQAAAEVLNSLLFS